MDTVNISHSLSSLTFKACSFSQSDNNMGVLNMGFHIALLDFTHGYSGRYLVWGSSNFSIQASILPVVCMVGSQKWMFSLSRIPLTSELALRFSCSYADEVCVNLSV